MMKNVIFTITVTTLCILLLSGCAAASGMVSPPQALEMAAGMPQKLRDLRFDGYENMSITQFREKAMEIIAENEEEYFSLIERVSVDTDIQDIRYTDADVSFVANILIPVIAENWKSWEFHNSCINGAGMAEYSISYSILDADHITMGERSRAVSSVMDGIQMVLAGRTDMELADEDGTRAVLEHKINELTGQFSDSSFQITAELAYRADNAGFTGQPGRRPLIRNWKDSDIDTAEAEYSWILI